MASSATKTETFVDKTYKNCFMTRMHQLRQTEEYTDVTLLSGDVNIRCHRNVLAAASDYFNAMFRCSLEESTSATVQLNMQPETLTSIVEYIYTGEIELTVDNVESLVKACDVLQLDTLKAACENFMLNRVEPANSVGFYKFAASYRLESLQQNARRVMVSEFKAVAFMEEFKELSCKELIELIKDDDVNVTSEDVVSDAVLDWVRHDLDNRKSSLETILEHVRLPYCTRNYLQHMKDTYDLLTLTCFEYLHEAVIFQLATVHQNEMSSCRTVPRTNYRMKSCLLVVGGLTPGDNVYKKCNLCHYYEEDTSCWKLLTELPQSVGILDDVCYTDRGMVMTGGIKEKTMNQCLLSDIAAKKWEAMPPLITKRYYHRSVSLGDCAYVMGGKGVDKEVLASVECLNLKSRQWSSLPAMPQAVFAPMVTTYRNKIFVFGGLDALNQTFCCTQVFDITLGKWNTLSDMPEVCWIGAAVTLNDFIYVVGGSRRTCLKYDPASDGWTRLSQPKQTHGNAPAVVWRGSILVAGGDGQESSVVEKYDPLTDTWSNCGIPPLKEGLKCHSMFNVDLYGTQYDIANN